MASGCSNPERMRIIESQHDPIHNGIGEFLQLHRILQGETVIFVCPGENKRQKGAPTPTETLWLLTHKKGSRMVTIVSPLPNEYLALTLDRLTEQRAAAVATEQDRRRQEYRSRIR